MPCPATPIGSYCSVRERLKQVRLSPKAKLQQCNVDELQSPLTWEILLNNMIENEKARRTADVFVKISDSFVNSSHIFSPIFASLSLLFSLQLEQQLPPWCSCICICICICPGAVVFVFAFVFALVGIHILSPSLLLSPARTAAATLV